MPQENPQKMKLLKLVKIFQEHTDERHPMTTQQLLSSLAEQGISCDRRTLAQDIELLNGEGYEILSTKVGHQNAYYLVDRLFSVPELRILVDAVQASRFITEEKSSEMIDKIAALGGRPVASRLKSNMIHSAVRKHTNNTVLFSISELEIAIERKNQVSFLYFDLDENGKKKYRRDGEKYVVHPVSLVFNRDNYYLVTYNTEQESIFTYRVDRMEAVTMLDLPVCDQALDCKEAEEFSSQVFSMYGGDTVRVTLEFTKEVLGAIHDRFGEKAPIRKSGNETYFLSADVQVSPTFWGWMFQFVGKMRITSPQSMVEEYIRQAQDINTIRQTQETGDSADCIAVEDRATAMNL